MGSSGQSGSERPNAVRADDRPPALVNSLGGQQTDDADADRQADEQTGEGSSPPAPRSSGPDRARNSERARETQRETQRESLRPAPAYPDDAETSRPVVFVSDPTVEAAKLEWALRARGYDTIDVPLAMLVGRVSVQRPQVILLDVDAPNALEVAARLRTLRGAGRIHVLFLGHTGRTFSGPRDAYSHDGSGFFARPLDVLSIVRKIDSLVESDGDEVPSGGVISSHPPPSLRGPESTRSSNETSNQESPSPARLSTGDTDVPSFLGAESTAETAAAQASGLDTPRRNSHSSPPNSLPNSSDSLPESPRSAAAWVPSSRGLPEEIWGLSDSRRMPPVVARFDADAMNAVPNAETVPIGGGSPSLLPATQATPGRGVSLPVGFATTLRELAANPKGDSQARPDRRLSPDLERLLHEAEARVRPPGELRDVDSELLSPEQEVEAVLPAEILASLDEPIDESDDEGSVDTGGNRYGTTGSGTNTGMGTNAGPHGLRSAPPPVLPPVLKIEPRTSDPRSSTHVPLVRPNPFEAPVSLVGRDFVGASRSPVESSVSEPQSPRPASTARISPEPRSFNSPEAPGAEGAPQVSPDESRQATSQFRGGELREFAERAGPFPGEHPPTQPPSRFESTPQPGVVVPSEQQPDADRQTHPGGRIPRVGTASDASELAPDHDSAASYVNYAARSANSGVQDGPHADHAPPLAPQTSRPPALRSPVHSPRSAEHAGLDSSPPAFASRDNSPPLRSPFPAARHAVPPPSPPPSADPGNVGRPNVGRENGEFASLAASETANRPFEKQTAAREQGPQNPPANAPAGAAVPPPTTVTTADEAMRTLANAVATRVSGVLRVDAKSGIRRIVLQDGDVVTAASSVEGESLVGYLVQRGDLPVALGRTIEARIPAFGRLAGAALVAHGHLHQDQLWDALQAHAAWLLTQVIGAVGRFAFELEPPARLRGEPPVFGGTPGPALIVEIARRAVPPDEAIRRLGGSQARVSVGQRKRLIDECGLEDDEAHEVASASGVVIREWTSRRGEDLAPTLYALVCLGILDVHAPAHPSEEDDHREVGLDAELDDAAVRERVLARRTLVEDADYFTLLGIARTATGYEVRRAYLDLRRVLDPARLLRPSLIDLEADLRIVLEVLDEAYDILKDPTRRERYRRAIMGDPKKSTK